VRSRAFPSPPQDPVVYAVLTDGNGEGTMSLVISRVDTLEELRERHWTMRFADPLRIIRLILRVPKLSFPVPGHYQFSLFADREWLAQTVLQVVSAED
jgi:hypothetical protein